jgi:glucose-6-phosphate isomerase, archaeal
MKLDVSSFAGFDLQLDTDTLQLETDSGIVFERTTRTAGRLKCVLRFPDAVAPDLALYYMYNIIHAPEHIQIKLDCYHLTFSPVLLPPGKVGREFIKTNGHYHPPIPGSSYTYPEIYTQLYGKLFLFLQRRNPSAPETPEDCVLLEMRPGVTITIPPGYAHVLINASDDLALMAGLYNVTFGPDYAEVERHRGLAYYILHGNDGIIVEPNPKYVDAPPLRRPVDIIGTCFAPFDPGVPLWQSFLASSSSYAFLSELDALRSYFHSDSPKSSAPSTSNGS